MIGDLLNVRRAIGDPPLSLIEAPFLPDAAREGVVYVIDEEARAYWQWTGRAWKEAALTFEDAHIERLIAEKGKNGAALGLVNELIARLGADGYITSGSAGGQSVSFPSLSEALEYYRLLKEAIMEEAARESGSGVGGWYRVKRPETGGVREEESEWP